AGEDVARVADSSFVHAMHITTLISAAITLLGALVVMRWMPGRAAATQPVPAPGTAAPAPAPTGAASRSGQGAADGAAGPGGSVAQEGSADASRRGEHRSHCPDHPVHR